MLAADEKTKEELRIPFGKVMQTRSLIAALRARKGLLIAVGDNSVYVLLQNGISPDIAIFDFLCKRQEVEQAVRDRLLGAYANAMRVKNPPGEITDEMLKAVVAAIAEKAGAIRVDGEEDLAALVAIGHAPGGALLVYGQPNEGAVLVRIDAKIRARARAIMSRMHTGD